MGARVWLLLILVVLERKDSVAIGYCSEMERNNWCFVRGHTVVSAFVCCFPTRVASLRVRSVRHSQGASRFGLPASSPQ